MGHPYVFVAIECQPTNAIEMSIKRKWHVICNILCGTLSLVTGEMCEQVSMCVCVCIVFDYAKIKVENGGNCA